MISPFLRAHKEAATEIYQTLRRWNFGVGCRHNCNAEKDLAVSKVAPALSGVRSKEEESWHLQ